MYRLVEKRANSFLLLILSCISISAFIIFYTNSLGLAYNDARSHLDIGRRVVEGLKPGIAQLGSVWLPLPHFLIMLTVWNDFMWHSGLSGAIVSMVSYVGTGFYIYKFLQTLRVGIVGRIAGVFAFALNTNILYLQSTAMTELLLSFTITGAIYELLAWEKEDKLMSLTKASFFVMLATLVRYEGWFLLLYTGVIVFIVVFRKKNFKAAKGMTFFFLTLSSLGVFLWFLWNQAIFKDALYFAFGPYSAHAQQQQLELAGQLPTKGNIFYSLKMYLYAMVFNAGAVTLIMGCIGAIAMFTDKRLNFNRKIVASCLIVPLIFNIIALYLGHSVLFIQGISGNTWFNVRYGVVMLPAIAIFIGYLLHRSRGYRYLFVIILVFVTLFALISKDAVTVDDARVGASHKNVSAAASWLEAHAKQTDGFILISAASHDAIIFSSNLPMKKFIHEGTGLYWANATNNPSKWARWIVMRTNDTNDATFSFLQRSHQLNRYTPVGKYPFADIYELKPEYRKDLITQPVLGNQNNK